MLPYPFLRREFLDALENSGSVGGQSGWQPMHLEAGNSFMPLYQKSHSWGEYVFDWAWADGYRRYGMDYYPKLVTAIPFTPASGPRIAGTTSEEHAHLLITQAVELCRSKNASSWHLLFPDVLQLELFQKNQALLTRTGVQYHWQNRGYRQFDDFLNALNSRKRKMVRRERKTVADQGISINLLRGEQIDQSSWQLFYLLYQRTYLKRSGSGGYLQESFFTHIAQSMPEQIAMAVAYRNNEAIACSLFFYDSDKLYGRYWGCLQEFDCLHFELCYYSGIELAIELGATTFDAGAQGEHKILRGFEPVAIHSLHWIADEDFRHAIGEFITREQQAVEQHMRQARELSPYRKITDGLPHD